MAMRAVLLAVLLLAACTGASPSPSPTPDPVRILATGLSLDSVAPLGVGAATTQAEYDSLWTGSDRSFGAPSIDFDLEIALYLGMAGSSSCPEEFMGLVVDPEAGVVYGSWRQPSALSACTDDLQSQGVLLAVSRAVLPSSEFLFSLREQPVCAECPDQPDRIVVNP